MHLSRFSAGVAFLAIAAGTLIITSPRSEAANDNNPTQDEKLKILIGQQSCRSASSLPARIPILSISVAISSMPSGAATATPIHSTWETLRRRSHSG